jgi:hyaluronan synthase
VGFAHSTSRLDGQGLDLRFIPLLIVCVAAILTIKYLTLPNLPADPLFGFYSIAVTAFILTSFALASLYRPRWTAEHLPAVTAIIPVKDEENLIGETLARYAQTDYPKDRLEVIVVDDGSTDGTWGRILGAQAQWNSRFPGHIQAHRFEGNRGKRVALAWAIRRAKGEIIVVNDSDSFISPSGLREIVRPFADGRIAGVSGHTDLANPSANALTKLQAGRYFVAFRVYKAVEALTGTVVCLSGSLSAYRRSALLGVLDAWEGQRFLGIPCTYGDDRGLTTLLLRRGYRTVYMPSARATTYVPQTLRQLWRQQLRWKKSWIRETWLASHFMWRRHPLAAVRFYVQAFLTLLSFVVVARVMFYLPLLHGQLPWLYLSGLILVALMYGLYYRMHQDTPLWGHAVLWSGLYAFVLVWQLPMALFTLRDTRWGTR